MWCIVAYDIDNDTWYEETAEPWNFARILETLENAHELIGHNIIQFDLPVLRRVFDFVPRGRVTDSLVVSRCLYPDRPGGHSLAAWGERLGYEKGEFTGFDSLSVEMLEYCRRDVEVNARLYRRLLAEQKGHDWGRSLELEHRIADIIAEQERRGFYFYKEQAQELVDEWSSRISSIDSSVLGELEYNIVPHRTVSKPFKINGEPTAASKRAAEESGLPCSVVNGPWTSVYYTKPDLNSKKQQKELLLSKGWVPETTTPSGQPKLDESILKVGTLGESLHERNVLSHRVSQVQGLIDLTDNESRIHGGANPCGTNTGRMRHSRIVNIPRATSPFGEEIRSLFGVPSGKYLVGYDASSLELRMLAHYIGDPSYNAKVCSTNKEDDAHTLAASAGGTDDRNVGKTINYALIYGAGDYKLGSIIGGTKRDGAVLRQRLYTEIPGLADLVARVERAARKGYLIGLDGRKLWIRQAHQALNTLIQGGGAVFMKTVTEALDRATKMDRVQESFKVCDMHDEAQWECTADYLMFFEKYVHDAFGEATIKLELTCPQQAEVIVGQNWAETH